MLEKLLGPDLFSQKLSRIYKHDTLNGDRPGRLMANKETNEQARSQTEGKMYMHMES